MPVGIKNLSGEARSRLLGNYPDIGQTFYVVDSNYRTIAQGWSKADRTGPLDLYDQRDAGYVYYCAGAGISGAYSADYLAIQAAIDAAVDYRGDAIYFTPGSYSVATALAVNVPDLRLLGSPVGSPMSARATITPTVASAFGFTSGAVRTEVAFLAFVPFTATHPFAFATGANNLHFHDFYYNTTGVAASTGTQFALAAGTITDSVFEDFIFRTDAGQGPMFELDGTTEGLIIQNFHHLHTVGTLAMSLLDVDGAAATCITIGPGFGQIGGAAGVVTTMVDIVNMTNASVNMTIRDFEGSVGYATNATLITSAGAVNDIDIVNSWIATVEGGAGRAAYIGAA